MFGESQNLCNRSVVKLYEVTQNHGWLYTIQNKLRTNCSQTCQIQSFELNDLKF